MIDLIPYTTSVISTLTVSIPYIIGALLGAFTTFLGYSLNEHSKNKEKKEKRLAARRMIKYEIDRNLQLLEQFYGEIKNNAEDNKRSLGYNLGNLSFPFVNEAALDKYSYLLSDSKENEFENIYKFYRFMEDLQLIHYKTGTLSDRSYSSTQIKNVLGKTVKEIVDGEEAYSNQFTELWVEFESIICSLIEEGNPIIL